MTNSETDVFYLLHTSPTLALETVSLSNDAGERDIALPLIGSITATPGPSDDREMSQPTYQPSVIQILKAGINRALGIKLLLYVMTVIRSAARQL